jgi:hypothetical protein
MEVQWALSLTRYGPSFRLARKIAERGFRPASLAQYRSLQERRTRVLVTRMLENSQEWVAHIELSGFSLFELSASSLNHLPVFKANNSLPWHTVTKSKGQMTGF